MIHARLFTLAVPFLLSSCALFSDDSADTAGQPVLAKRVDNSMLQHVPDAERSDVTEARQAADVARDAHAAAKSDTLQSAERRKLADRELDIAQDEQKRAEQALKISENGTQEELEAAKQAVSDTTALVASGRSRIAWRESQLACSRSVENLKFRESALAQAKVEETKAHAVKQLDRPQAKSLDVPSFELQVRKCKEEVDLARVRADAAKKEVAAARAAYDLNVKAVPASYRKDWSDDDVEAKNERNRD